jgi:hypothetical protein
VLHDLGLTEGFVGRGRFEVVGADVADRFLAAQGVAAERREIIRDAIALHAQLGIASRKRPEIALVHIGAGVDVLGVGLDKFPAAVVESVIAALPRLDFKRAFFNVLVEVIRKSQAAVGHTWMMEIARGHVHGYGCATLQASMVAARFEE